MEEEEKKEQQETKEPEKKEEGDITTNKYVWIMGAVILLVAGWFGIKALLGPSENYKVTLIDAPKEVTKGGIATFTWLVDGPPVLIHHSAVHTGKESQPGELGKEVKPADTKYTDFVKDFAQGDFNIPLQFIGNITLNDEGTYYFRVHATVNDKHFWTDEYTLEVKPAAVVPTALPTEQAATRGASPEPTK